MLVIGILNFGEGLLALNYLIFCALASLGVLQLVAAQGRYVGLMLLPAAISRWLGAGLLVGAYAWFFTIQPDLFIPGLAGGEFFLLFALGFAVGLLLALGLGTLSTLFAQLKQARPASGQTIQLKEREQAELWVPPSGRGDEAARPPLVLALREAESDSLDVLGHQLTAGGAAVLLCRQQALGAALEFIERATARFDPSRRYVVGVGRGANAALRLAEMDGRFRAVAALGPFGRRENTRPGLRWLQEMDYLTALRLSFRPQELEPAATSRKALVIFGDEDVLTDPETARQIYPDAVFVGGARHFTLAASPAAARLVADWFELRLPVVGKPEPAQTQRVAARGEMSE